MPVVLIVEDESQVLAMAESVLQNEGYATLSAATEDEALAIVHSDQQIDLLFTDLGLTKDDPGAGLRIAQAFAERRPDVPVLYTTARGVTDGMIALFVKPNGFLAKPYMVDQLIKAVCELVPHQQPQPKH
jgi:CheY-like chemotaxis protein